MGSILSEVRKENAVKIDDRAHESNTNTEIPNGLKKWLPAIILLCLGLQIANDLFSANPGHVARWDGLWFALIAVVLVLPYFFHKTFGVVDLVQIFSPNFEQRIRVRYQAETTQLGFLGFDQLFFVGDSISVFRILLIFPAIVALQMGRDRVPMTIKGGTRLLTGNPVFISRDRTAYAHPNSLGFTFHTRFQDGTFLVSKNFGDDSDYISEIVGNTRPAASVSDTWAAHQQRMKELETQGKRVDRQTSFEAYREIVLKEQTRR
jgi:hypothetical protein